MNVLRQDTQRAMLSMLVEGCSIRKCTSTAFHSHIDSGGVSPYATWLDGSLPDWRSGPCDGPRLMGDGGLRQVGLLRNSGGRSVGMLV